MPKKECHITYNGFPLCSYSLAFTETKYGVDMKCGYYSVGEAEAKLKQIPVGARHHFEIVKRPCPSLLSNVWGPHRQEG